MSEGTEHLRAYTALRDSILLGALAPGQSLTIHGAATQIGAGITPVREAIRRLVSEGALELGDNRRITVPRMTAAQLADVALARTRLEPELARRAIGALDNAAIARLEATDASARLALAHGDLPGYLRHNRDFHFGIYEAGSSDVLGQIVGAMWLRLGPAMCAVSGFFRDETGGLTTTADEDEPHRQAIAALRARDAGALSKAIEQDIARGTALLARGINEGKL